MNLTTTDLARMIDCSVVRAEVSAADLKEFAREVRRHQFIGAHVLPYYVAELNGLLAGESEILIGTSIGFPSGAHTTEVKIHEAKRALHDGARELDMVINVGALRSKRYEYVEDEIRAIVETAGGKTVKVILEVAYLTDDEIRRACELCIKARADFVKTSTGWAPSGATVANVAMIKSFVGDAIGVKAAGGIRDLSTLLAMYKHGATRFGISLRSALKIMDECETGRGGVIAV